MNGSSLKTMALLVGILLTTVLCSCGGGDEGNGNGGKGKEGGEGNEGKDGGTNPDAGSGLTPDAGPTVPGAPSINFINPTDGAAVCGTITLEATAVAEANSVLVEIGFYADDQLLGNDQTPPYTAEWDTKQATAGSHRLTAVAKDDKGREGRAEISVVVSNEGSCDNAPTVSFTSPTDGSFFKGNEPISLAVEASDDIGVTKVQFFADNGSIAEDATVPFEASWDPTSFAEGPHTLKALAYDTGGNTGQRVITVTLDRTPPVVKITSPKDGDVFTAGDSVEIVVEATDVSGVQGVAFYAHGITCDWFESIGDGWLDEPPWKVVWNIPPTMEACEVEVTTEAIDGVENQNSYPEYGGDAVTISVQAGETPDGGETDGGEKECDPATTDSLCVSETRFGFCDYPGLITPAMDECYGTEPVCYEYTEPYSERKEAVCACRENEGECNGPSIRSCQKGQNPYPEAEEKPCYGVVMEPFGPDYGFLGATECVMVGGKATCRCVPGEEGYGHCHWAGVGMTMTIERFICAEDGTVQEHGSCTCEGSECQEGLGCLNGGECTESSGG